MTSIRVKAEENGGRVSVTNNMCEMVFDVFVHHYSNNDMVDDDNFGVESSHTMMVHFFLLNAKWTT